MLARATLLGLAVAIAAAPLGAAVSKLVLDQMILPVTEEILVRAIETAEERGDELLIVQLSTPGGLEQVTRRIINRILSSPVPIAVWVAPSGERAASAGFFILQSADVAAMAPGTNTGAAHPVILGVELDEVMEKKMANDSAAFIRSIAAKRGRNVEAAESAVRESISFTEEEALEKGLIELIAASDRELVQKLSGREFRRWNGSVVRLELSDAAIEPIPMTLRHQVLSWIMDPNIAFILFSIGMLALWAEFQHPGAIVPGVIGALFLLLAVIALNMLPTRFAALALIVGAFVFFALEAKFASHGALGIAGVISMFLGAILLVEGPIPEMRVNWATALVVSLSFGVIAVFLMSLALRALKEPVTTGTEGMVGEIGVASTRLDPSGKVFVHGEIWNAVASTPVEEGQQVRVTHVHDLIVDVEPVTKV